MIDDLALTESRTLRGQYADRVDVLDRVKVVALLPDGVHATTDLVASYYEVDVKTIEKLVERNREELETNGYRVLRGDQLRKFETDNLSVSKRRALALFTRRAILNVAMLLTDSPVARRVRTYLLDVEDIAPTELRTEAIERAAISRAQLRMLDAAAGLVDRDWLAAKARVVLARGLGEEPEIDPADRPLYVPDYLRERGITSRRDLASIQSWFGRRLVAMAEAEGISVPELRVSELPNGQLRETRAWTQRHRPVFDAVWDRWYAADYEPQAALMPVGE